ncbi:Gfo/Idh/MocA family protein [Komagataeibacter saccharivorans]|uniref:Gfo/Idh/MocA family protein n=1 Tax=Komagataeibacter saccharivorans TaxID=265959 RepID=UPI000C822C0C
MNWPFGILTPRITVFFDPAQGGGSLLDLGIYLISLSQFFLGEPDAVRGEWYSAPSGVDMGARMELTFGRIPASLNCAFDHTGGNLFIIEGSRRTLFLQSPFIGAGRFWKPVRSWPG